MANNKIGLNYYNVDTDRYQDIKIKRLKKDFGCSGIAVFDYILCEIYRVKGCFIAWDESTAFDVAEYFGIKESLVNEIVNYCGVVGLFDKGLLTRGSILTSLPIQTRYLDFCVKAKRANCEIPKSVKIQEESSIIQEVCPIIQEESSIIQEVCDEVKRSKENRSKIPPLSPKGKTVEEKFIEMVLEEWRPVVKLWLDFKKEKGQKYKGEITLNEMFEKLKALSGDNPEKGMLIVKQSIASNYSGLFELKNKSPHPATNYKSQNSYAERF